MDEAGMKKSVKLAAAIASLLCLAIASILSFLYVIYALAD
jgi:hypothetical protein